MFEWNGRGITHRAVACLKPELAVQGLSAACYGNTDKWHFLEITGNQSFMCQYGGDKRCMSWVETCPLMYLEFFSTH